MVGFVIKKPTKVDISWKKNIHSQSGGDVEYADYISDDKTTHNDCHELDTEQSDGEDIVLELWGLQSNPLLPLLPGQLWSLVVIYVSAPSMGQIELFNGVKTNDWCEIELLILSKILETI